MPCDNGRCAGAVLFVGFDTPIGVQPYQLISPRLLMPQQNVIPETSVTDD